MDLRWGTGTCYKAHERCGDCHRCPLLRPAINGVASAGRAKLFCLLRFLFSLLLQFSTLSSLGRVPDSCRFPTGLRARTRASHLGGSCRMREEITGRFWWRPGSPTPERAPNLRAVTLLQFRIVDFISTEFNEASARCPCRRSMDGV